MKYTLFLFVFLSVSWAKMAHLERADDSPAPAKSWVGLQSGLLFLESDQATILGFEVGALYNPSWKMSLVFSTLLQEPNISKFLAVEMKNLVFNNEYAVFDKAGFSVNGIGAVGISFLCNIPKAAPTEEECATLPYLAAGLGLEYQISNYSFGVSSLYQYIPFLDFKDMSHQFWNKPLAKVFFRYWI